MKLSKAIEGFLLSKSAEGLSKRTLETYRQQLAHLTLFLQDIHLEQISTHDLRRFFDYLRNEYKPKRWNGEARALTGRTIHNYWICLRSFWTWACKEFDVQDVIKSIPAPKANIAQSEPYTAEEVKAILSMAEAWSREPRRNVAIILTLLDTGIRSSELCDLRVGDLNLKLGKLTVEGKGDKVRFVYVGEHTRRALWRYLVDRDEDPADYLFLTRKGYQMRTYWVHGIIRKIGEKAGIKNAYPHRFRHTFAVTYLRNGGDIFTLQILLGHSSLKMVRYYAQVADVDAAIAHKRASPVDNWLR